MIRFFLNYHVEHPHVISILTSILNQISYYFNSVMTKGLIYLMKFTKPLI